ncbi:MAG: hypothetical protein Q9202_001568 [Teloschistes flavicans]
MPRTLPWLKDQVPTKNRPSAAPPAKRQRPLDPDSEGSDNARSRQRVRAEQRREAAKKAGRTPSTSPPPAPPAVEYLRPGLAHDDIYIMVDDEFLSTASLYTSHLHHAEYIRLKNLAKARAQSSSSLPTTRLTAVEAGRGTDGKTGMRRETVQKQKLQQKEKGNEAAVEGMRKEARDAIAGSDSSSRGEGDEDEDEEDGVNAPWAGTSLHKLMAPIEKTNLTSLTGLQGIQSHTRAAKGYAKPEEGNPRTVSQATPKKKTVEVRAGFGKEVGFTTSRIPQASSSRRQAMSPSVSSSPASSDLDALPPLRSKASKPPPPSSKPSDPLTLAASDLFHLSQRHAPLASNHRSRPLKPDPSPPTKPSRPHRPPDLVSADDGDEAAAAARRRLQMRRDRATAEVAMREKKKMMAEGDGRRMDVKGNVDEIPVFLV